MTPSKKTPEQRAEVLLRINEKLSANDGHISLEEAYAVFKEIESEMQAAEDDPQLYDGLSRMRSELKRAMEARAQDLGKAEDWAIVMDGHDLNLMLRPLFRAQDDPDEYAKAYRALSPEQVAALDRWEKKTGIQIPRGLKSKKV